MPRPAPLFNADKASETRAMTLLERAQAQPKSRALATKAKCWDCGGQDADPCWKWRIGNCDIEDCGLWLVRPYQHLYKTPVPKALLKIGWQEE